MDNEEVYSSKNVNMGFILTNPTDVKLMDAIEQYLEATGRYFEPETFEEDNSRNVNTNFSYKEREEMEDFLFALDQAGVYYKTKTFYNEACTGGRKKKKMKESEGESHWIGIVADKQNETQMKDLKLIQLFLAELKKDPKHSDLDVSDVSVDGEDIADIHVLFEPSQYDIKEKLVGMLKKSSLHYDIDHIGDHPMESKMNENKRIRGNWVKLTADPNNPAAMEDLEDLKFSLGMLDNLKPTETVNKDGKIEILVRYKKFHYEEYESLRRLLKTGLENLEWVDSEDLDKDGNPIVLEPSWLTLGSYMRDDLDLGLKMLQQEIADKYPNYNMTIEPDDSSEFKLFVKSPSGKIFTFWFQLDQPSNKYLLHSDSKVIKSINDIWAELKHIEESKMNEGVMDIIKGAWQKVKATWDSAEDISGYIGFIQDQVATFDVDELQTVINEPVEDQYDKIRNTFAQMELNKRPQSESMNEDNSEIYYCQVICYQRDGSQDEMFCKHDKEGNFALDNSGAVFLQSEKNLQDAIIDGKPHNTSDEVSVCSVDGADIAIVDQNLKMVEGPFDSPEEAFEVVDEMNLNLIESKTLQESSHNIPKVGDIVVDWANHELEVLAVYDTTDDPGLEKLANDWGDTIEGDFMLDLDEHDYWIVAIPPGDRFEMIYAFGDGGVELKENREPMDIGESDTSCVDNLVTMIRYDEEQMKDLVEFLNDFVGKDLVDITAEKDHKEIIDSVKHYLTANQVDVTELGWDEVSQKEITRLLNSVKKKMSTTVPDAE